MSFLTLRAGICGVLVAAGLMAGVSTADAQSRFGAARYNPPYGTPFPDLDFFGDIKVTDGGCIFNNNIQCAGSLSFVSATLKFGKVPLSITAIPPALQTINFTSPQFGQVLTIDRANLTDWSGVTSTAFRAVQGTVGNTPGDPLLTAYDPPGIAQPAQAWFSLVLVGNAAQVIWFQNDPGAPFLSFLNGEPFTPNPQYAQCFGKGPGVKTISNVFGRVVNTCGLSSYTLDGSNGAPLLNEAGLPGFSVTVVPEPEAYAMGLAGLGVIGFMTLLSRRRSAKS